MKAHSAVLVQEVWGSAASLSASCAEIAISFQVKDDHEQADQKYVIDRLRFPDIFLHNITKLYLFPEVMAKITLMLYTEQCIYCWG